MKESALVGLMPLEPPPPPAVDVWPLAGLVVLAILVGVIGLWLWLRPQRRRLRQLAGLQRRLQRSVSDTRQLAGELEALLCNALGIPRLESDTPPRSVDAAHWQRLTGSLRSARFSATGIGQEQLTALLPDIRQLLQQARDRA